MTQLGAATRSGPGWHSILLGVEPEKHEVFVNETADTRNYDYKTFLWRAKNEFGLRTMTTFSYRHDWFAESLLEADAADYAKFQSEEDSTVLLEAELKNNDYELIFFQLKDVDLTGHRTGFDKDNPFYVSAIERVDSQIKRCLDAIAARENRDQEEWLIVVTSDHGGGGIDYFSHGDYSRLDRRILLTISGDGIRPGHIGADCNNTVS